MARRTGKSSKSDRESAAEQSERPDGKRPELKPGTLEKLSEIRSRIEKSVGQIVLQMMQQARYRHQTLADLTHLVIEPLLHDRIAIALGKERAAGGSAGPAPIGIAIWASVSESVHSAIQEQVKAGAFPIRITAEDWVSGDNLWLLDIIAISQKAASAVFVNFKDIAGDRRVNLHPLVAQSVDQELLRKIQVSAPGRHGSVEPAPVI